MTTRRTKRHKRATEPMIVSRPRGRAACWRAALVALSLLGGPAAWASPPDIAKAELQAALTDLDALARQTRQAGDLPRWSDPEGARVLGRVWNLRTILGAPPYVAADTPMLLDIFDRQNAVYKTYLLFTAVPGELPDTAVNTIRYQDELVRAASVILHVFAAEVDALAAFWTSLPDEARTPTRRAGAQQAQAGLVEFVTGVMTVLRVPNLKPDSRRILTQTLDETGDAIARALTQPDRLGLSAQITAAEAAQSPEGRGQLAPFVTALARTDCTGVCAIR